MKLIDYVSRISEISGEYQVSPYYLHGLMEVHDRKREHRGLESDEEKSLDVIERYLSIKYNRGETK